MSISLADPRLSLEDKLGFIHERVRSHFHAPPVVPTREFYHKIENAAREAGLRDHQVYEWNRKLLGSMFTDGCLREAGLLLPPEEMRYDHEKDIGYFRRGQGGKYTVRSFKINALVFSDERYRRFQQALEGNGLEPSAHSCLGTVFSTDAEVRARKMREPRYR